MRSSLTTRLHRQLASPEWIRTLEALVATRVRQSGQLKTDSGSGSVTSKLSHERFMGPHSIVKYRFLVAVQVSRGPETEPDRYEARVVWHPAAMSFSLEGEVYTTVEGAAAQRSRTQLEIGVARSVDSTDSLSAFSRLSCHICRSPLEIEWYSKGLTWRCWCRQRPSHFSQMLQNLLRNLPSDEGAGRGIEEVDPKRLRPLGE